METETNPKCNMCGKPATIYANDPFEMEMYDRDTGDEWWCQECYEDRQYEV
jgi:hypothetical protein